MSLQDLELQNSHSYISSLMYTKPKWSKTTSTTTHIHSNLHDITPMATKMHMILSRYAIFIDALDA